jgi:hypothetical protein
MDRIPVNIPRAGIAQTRLARGISRQSVIQDMPVGGALIGQLHIE